MELEGLCNRGYVRRIPFCARLPGQLHSEELLLCTGSCCPSNEESGRILFIIYTGGWATKTLALENNLHLCSRIGMCTDRYCFREVRLSALSSYDVSVLRVAAPSLPTRCWQRCINEMRWDLLYVEQAAKLLFEASESNFEFLLGCVVSGCTRTDWYLLFDLLQIKCEATSCKGELRSFPPQNSKERKLG